MTEVIVMMPCCGGPIYFPSDVEQISEHVYILGDGDPAGRKWAGELSGKIPGATSRVQPKGYDVTSYLVEFGAQSFLESVCL